MPFRRVASSGSGPSFGRLAAKDKRRSHSSASCRRWSGDGRTTGFRLYGKTGGTAPGLNLGFWRGRLKARLSLSKPCPGRVVGRQEALAANNSAGWNVKYSPSYRRLATSYRARRLSSQENVWKLRFVHLSCMLVPRGTHQWSWLCIGIPDNRQQLLNRIANGKPRRIHIQKYTPRPITTLSNQIFAPSRTQTIIWKTVYPSKCSQSLIQEYSGRVFWHSTLRHYANGRCGQWRHNHVSLQQFCALSFMHATSNLTWEQKVPGNTCNKWLLTETTHDTCMSMHLALVREEEDDGEHHQMHHHHRQWNISRLPPSLQLESHSAGAIGKCWAGRSSWLVRRSIDCTYTATTW